jgi:hypothetical protein
MGFEKDWTVEKIDSLAMKKIDWDSQRRRLVAVLACSLLTIISHFLSIPVVYHKGALLK